MTRDFFWYITHTQKSGNTCVVTQSENEGDVNIFPFETFLKQTSARRGALPGISRISFNFKLTERKIDEYFVEIDY